MTDVTDAAFNTNANWWALIQLVVIVWAIFKIFSATEARRILLIHLCRLPAHASSARGYTDGFSAWCRQVAAICFTAFMQNLLYLLALIMLQDAETTSLYFGLGLMLVGG